MSQQSNKPMRFVWALDPYETQLKPGPEAVSALKVLAGNSLQYAAPIFVSGTDIGGANDDQLKVENYLRSFVTESMAAPVVRYAGSPEKREWVAQVLNYAREQQAEMIVLTSHGRETMARLFLGSFAESLLEASTLPVLFLQKSASNGGAPAQGVFATDFSEASGRAFEKFLQSFGSQLKEITLFHAVTFPEGALGMAGAAGVPVVYPESFIKEQYEWAKSQSKLWLEKAMKAQPSCQIRAVLEDKVVMNPSAAILEYAARHKVDLLAMTSHTGAVGKFFLGSVTQDLIHSRKFPVWVCGPKF